MSQEFAPTILLLGCGYTLTRLLKKLPVNSVLYTTRSSSSLEDAPALIGNRYHGEVVNPYDAAALEALFKQYPSIDTIIDSVPPRAEEGSDPLTGVKNLCEIIVTKKLKRLFYLSTTGVYGVQDGSEVDEKTECAPSNPRAQARLSSEELYRSAFSNVVNFRIAAIYGPGRGLGLSLKNGNFKKIRGKNRWSNRIHVDDLVTVLHATLKFKGILPPVFNVADDTPTQINEVIDYYCSKFNFAPPGEISEEEAQKSEMYNQMSDQKIINRLIREELGVKLKFPSYKEGAGSEFF
jgi:nucleoside-diphosphate-sugar epimerase